MVYTSRYSNPELRSGNYTAVRISVGAPRWKVGYDIAGVIRDLTPGELRRIENIDEFRPLYYAQLDKIGVDRIREQIQYYESFGKPVVLLCFEDIRKGSYNWCHRNVFASWWFSKTGELISELKDDSPFKVETPKVKAPKNEKPKPEKPKNEFLLFDVKLLIKFVYASDNTEVAYVVDRDTGKQKRIRRLDALKMIEDGKAEIVNFKDEEN